MENISIYSNTSFIISDQIHSKALGIGLSWDLSSPNHGTEDLSYPSSETKIKIDFRIMRLNKIISVFAWLWSQLCQVRVWGILKVLQ